MVDFNQIINRINNAIENLNSSDRTTKQAAIYIFPQIMNEKYKVQEALEVKELIEPHIPKLIDIMKNDDDIGLRLVALKSLANMVFYKEAYPEILKIFESRNMENNLSWEAGQVLLKYPNSYPEVKEILLEMFQTSDRDGRQIGLAMLRKYCENSLGRLKLESPGSISMEQIQKDWLEIVRNLIREAKTLEDSKPIWTTLGRISPSIDEEIKLFQREFLYNIIFDLLNQFQPDIQVQLNRIIELSKPMINERGLIHSIASLSNYPYPSELYVELIKEIVINGDIKGEFFELEHVFVKKDKETHFSLTSSTIAKKYLCYNCGADIDKKDITCKTCNEKILRCTICKLLISFGEEIGKCKHCDGVNHLSHLQEWIKIKGKCPTCQKKLTQEEILLSS